VARRLDKPNRYGGTTDHEDEIKLLRYVADRIMEFNPPNTERWVVNLNLAADLLESHDQSGISLDDWVWARRFVEHYLGKSIIPNLI
jgi:hypothetical protein